MDRLSLMLARAGQAIRALMLREARDTHLTPVQLQTLLFVRHTKSFATSISRLALQLGASHASTVGVVDGLVAHGYLERGLTELLASFERAGIAPAGAPCEGCRYFARAATPTATMPHYCNLLQEGISEAEAVKDCPDFSPSVA